MDAAADRLDLVACFHTKSDGAAFHAQNRCGCSYPQADRRRRDMAHVEVNAETLMAGGKKVFDRVECGRLDDVYHHRRSQYRDASRTDKGRSVLWPDQKLRGPSEAGGDEGEIDHV